MHKEFQMSMMGESNFFLGLQINQAKYTKDLLKRLNLENVKHASTPMASNTKLDNDPSGKVVDATKYRGMIDSLLYLTYSKQARHSF